MSEPNSVLQNLTIRQANTEQRVEIIKRVAVQWGTPQIGLEYYNHLHDLVETKEYAKDGKVIHW
jgi:hypothetical protein